jgi:hypothetical protein
VAAGSDWKKIREEFNRQGRYVLASQVDRTCSGLEDEEQIAVGFDASSQHALRDAACCVDVLFDLT